MKRLRLSLALLLAGAALAASADSLDGIAMRMALNNPAVASARTGYDADLAAARADNTLAGLEVEGSYSVSRDGADDNRWGVSVGQDFDWPGVYAARRKANGYRAEAFGYLYRAELEQAAYEAKCAIIRLAQAEADVRVIHTAHENMDRMSDVVDKAFERGDVTILEVHKLRIERFATASRCAKAAAEAESARAAVKALNGGLLPELPADILDCSEPLPLDVYTEAFRRGNPAAAARRSLAQLAESEVSVTRRAALPSFRLAYAHDYEDRTHFNGISLSVSLPSWSPGTRVAAAKARAIAAQLDTESYDISVFTGLMDNYSKAVRLYERLSEAAPTFDSDVYPELLLTALRTGKLDVVTYLTEYNQYLTAAADYQDLRAELAYAMAYLNRYNVAL